MFPNPRLISSLLGTVLTFGSVGVTAVQLQQQQAKDAEPIAVSDRTTQQANLTISTIPGNVWVKVNDYTYTERIPPQIDLSGWAEGFPVQAVVRDAQGRCIGRITNESGQLAFIFVEADPPMCGGAVPGPRQQVASEALG
ncbi:hypothetical protein ACQ4M4_25830 [Leptolyngbya sp. AN02str]|uniref:hypothetical protein n=1 Tax=Leptolyngbya sp. AN02str TaxID=3423363 RepID=UPI003D310CD4